MLQKSKSLILLLSLIAFVLLFSGFRFLRGELSLHASLSGMAEKWPQVRLLRNPELEDFAPKEWKNSYMDINATEISDVNLTKLLPVLMLELDKYPPSLLNKNLEAVVVVESFSLSGVNQLSANVGKRIYLTRAALSNPLEGYAAVHRELTGVLLRHHDFPLMKWGRHMPDYRETVSISSFLQMEINEESKESCDPGKSIDEQLQHAGLDRLQLESEIGLMSSRLFSEPKVLKSQARENEQVSAKLDLLTGFYNKLEPGYAWQF
ncbi:MAG: hypothetical protein OEZ68_19625 [Gammaproteobacteria bacterium]|nr:hypothetical protein [Gammaproteobacteria bacterium]MDH5803020.1 hypothetical protein [Gammaproteobacteria bacterium]